MKQFILIIILSFGSLTAQQNLSNEIELNLDKSLELAEKNNYNLKLARFNKERADEQVSETWGNSVFPNISGNVRYQRAIKRGEFTIETPFFEGSFPVGTENTLSAGVTLDQPLFTGSMFLAIRIARTYAEAADLGVNATLNEIKLNVKKAYYGVLLAKEAVELAKVNYKLAEDNVRTAKSLYDAGLVNEYEYIRAKVQQSNLLPEVENAENSLTLSFNALAILLGLPLNQKIIIKDSLTFNEYNITDYENLLNELDKNYNLRQLELQTKLREDAVSVRVNEYFPSLNLFGNWQAEAQENDPRSFNNWRYKNAVSVGLLLKVPIFNGFQTAAKIEQAKIDHKEALEQFIFTKKILQNNLQEVLLNIINNKSKINSYKESVSEAELAYSISSNRFASGLGTQLEVLDASVSLFRAKINYLSAVYDYKVNYAKLESLINQ